MDISEIEKAFEKAYGKGSRKKVVCKPSKKTKQSIKSIRKFLKTLDDAHEATKGSKLRFV